MRGAGAAALVLLWPQLLLLGGIVARREPKRPRQPGPRAEPPNATVAGGEAPPGSPKVRSGRRTGPSRTPLRPPSHLGKVGWAPTPRAPPASPPCPQPGVGRAWGGRRIQSRAPRTP